MSVTLIYIAIIIAPENMDDAEVSGVISFDLFICGFEISKP